MLLVYLCFRHDIFNLIKPLREETGQVPLKTKRVIISNQPVYSSPVVRTEWNNQEKSLLSMDKVWFVPRPLVIYSTLDMYHRNQTVNYVIQTSIPLT